MMQTNLGYLNQRQEVLSKNIANANVPGYMAKDLKAPDFASMMNTSTSGASSVNLALTQTGHMSAGGGGSSKFIEITKPIKEGEVTPSGNNVVLEDEVLKMSKVSLEYQQTADMMRKMVGLIQTAIGNV